MPCPSGGMRMVWLPSILTITVALRAISRELRGLTRTTTEEVSVHRHNGSCWHECRGFITNFDVVRHILSPELFPLGTAILSCHE